MSVCNLWLVLPPALSQRSVSVSAHLEKAVAQERDIYCVWRWPKVPAQHPKARVDKSVHIQIWVATASQLTVLCIVYTWSDSV